MPVFDNFPGLRWRSLTTSRDPMPEQRVEKGILNSELEFAINTIHWYQVFFRILICSATRIKQALNKTLLFELQYQAE